MLSEIFFYKVNVIDSEGFAVEVIEDPCIGFEIEGQLVGVQRLTAGFTELLVLAFAAVFAVAQQRPACISHLCADLVGAACEQFTFYQRKTVLGFQKLVLGLRELCAGFRLLFHIDLILLCVLEDVSGQKAFGGRGSAVDGTEVKFIKLTVLDFIV